jgi:Protein of unknown function (DUF4089)
MIFAGKAVSTFPDHGLGRIEWRAMSADPLDDYIDAVAGALALPVEDAWRPAVRANLDVSLKLARMVDAFALPDDTEPASVFTA